MVDPAQRAIERARQDAEIERRRDREQAASDASRTEQPEDTPK